MRGTGTPISSSTGCSSTPPRGKADFIGVNYYFRGRVTGLDAPVARDIPLLDFVAATSYRTELSPDLPECLAQCSDFGSEIYPEGFRRF